MSQISNEFDITVKCKYLLYLPENYGDKNQKWPLIFFLHGADEKGNNLELVKRHGPPKLIEEGKSFKFVVASPQCPQGQLWSGKIDALISLLDHIIENYEIDANRIYLTGLSMGGYGTWAMGMLYPERFAAIAPICGGGDHRFCPRLRQVPVWAFHGAKDNCAPVEESEKMVTAINAAGGNAKLTIYPEAEHDCWTQTYSNPELYEWFLSNSISDRKYCLIR
jgi:predicted peptidase